MAEIPALPATGDLITSGIAPVRRPCPINPPRSASRPTRTNPAAPVGTIYGETDDFSYNIVKDPVHVHDFHATILKLLGIDHTRFTYRFQGLDQKLTGVEKASPIQELIA